MSDTYNGYRNWETWNLSLWFDNDEGLYNMYIEQRPHNAQNAAQIAYDVFPDGTPDMDNADDMGKVDFEEVAGVWNAD